MSAHPSDKKLSIQVLDDNPFYATFLEHQLKQYFAAHFPEFSDIVITSFTHNADYLDALPETVSISLIDFYLEDGITGIDLLPEIKKRSAACRVIIMTTENNLEALANCLDTNVAGFVFKDESTVSLCHPIFEREIQRLQDQEGKA
jgi:response regulator of citrate/malate metabolism